MSQKLSKELCGSGCGGLPTERNRYFTGKYMTARDFAGEQAYFLDRQRLHNRLFHGWGIVCGLRVLHHPNAQCRENWVVVKAGVAVDCCGREVYLAEDTPIEVPLDELPLADEDEPGDNGNDGDRDEGVSEEESGTYETQATKRRPPRQRERRRRHDDDKDDHDHHDHDDDEHHHGGDHWHGGWHHDEDWPHNGLLVCLRYDEELIEPVPALYAEGHCDRRRHEANRIREVPRLEFHRLDRMEPDCWRMPSGAWHEQCKDDCDETLPGPSGACIEPDCPCGGCVPLGLLVRHPNPEPGEPVFEIDLRGRRHLPTPAHYLTHIVGINWPHGGEVTLDELLYDMDAKLKIRFDRKLLPADGVSTGINRRTITVEYGGISRSMELLASPEDEEPGLDDDGCTAVYPIVQEYLRGRDNIAGYFVYITLRCDFVLDCHEMPVDGSHLRGRLPSGNGIPGGEFVSWFRVVHHHGSEEED